MAVRRKRRTKAKPGSRGFEPGEIAGAAVPAAVRELGEGVTADGGVVLSAYRDPLGGEWLVFAALPVEKVEPTPYQRDLSDAHVKRLADAIERLGRYLDPIVAVRAESGYWTPNGHHRLAALKRLGAKTVTALVVPDPRVAHRILALNTEKAHNIRERALEVSRLAEALAVLDDRPEEQFETEFEEPALITLGFCYQRNGRFSGGAYHPVLKRVDAFLTAKLSKAVQTRRERAGRLLELDAAVTDAVARLKARGFESPYLKAFVVARINPLRFKRGATAEFDPTVTAMLEAARRFDAARVKADQLAAASGPPEE
jgi:ParB family chromosome partitioning protein